MEKELYKMKEVSEALSIPLNTLQHWRYLGKLKVVKIGRSVRVPKEEYERLKKGE